MSSTDNKVEELHQLAEQVNLEPRQHWDKKIDTPYPLIDNDPHFKRVVSYFRAEDYAAWGIGTAFFPAAFYFLEKREVSVPKARLPANLMFCAALGTIGGFLYAYQSSSKRFWGWSENERERLRDIKELGNKYKNEQKLYGQSSLDTYYQQAAANNSRYSALKFGAIPWFNFVNHPHHGVDEKQYQQKE
ncbi:hypothetical protein K502DRAFT_325999 [Neoconidiobolus thromboides FSU 785]|nr:hypothetical protein K502DRAFT_325999 [Neoconidiobolus thromboides FSU 785]